MMTKRRAFTLIELLTVIAISALLMTIIVVPVFQSFNFTRSAQAFAEAQSRARIVADRISREIGDSAGVRSSGLLVSTILNGVTANVPQHSLIVQVPEQQVNPNATQGTIEVVLPYVKLDLLKAAQADLYGGTLSNGGYTNPNNGYKDPTLQAPRGQTILPVGMGQTIVRYFVGLRDPFSKYNNPYDGILMAIAGGRDNLFVLYRAEVQPYVYRTGQGTNGDVSTKFRPNLNFFQTDALTDTQIEGYDDPRFFLNDGLGYDGTADPLKTQRVTNWRSVATIQSELNRYDMIQPVYNKFTHAATYNGMAPRIVPLIQFRPSHVGNDPAQGQVTVREGEESNNAAALAPDVYKTQYGLWSNQIVRTWPQTWDPTGAVNTVSAYFVGRNDPSNGQAGAPPGFSEYYFDPTGGVQSDVNSGTEVFDMYTYDFVTANSGYYPFSQAVNAANLRSGWMTNPTISSLFVPYDLNSAKGKLITSFGIWEVGNPNIPPTLTNPQNLPTVLTNPTNSGPFAAGQDPNVSGNFYDPAFSTVNELFNWVWANATNLQPQIDRFIDLRNVPNADGTANPLNPTTGLAKSRITPGSEIVYGPDQMAGPNFGQTVRYVRTTQNPGPNQYQINYVDQPEPTNTAGNIDYTLLGLTAQQLDTDGKAFNPSVYDPHNFCSAVIQPRFKKGYIKFNSDPTAPLPVGQIQISYRFQFNGTQTGAVINGAKSDVFAVDYDTRQLMSVLLTIRNYPQTTNIPNPQSVTLKATASVRNYLR